MKKSKLSINTLIKRKNLLLMLKNKGINQTRKEALALIEKMIEKNLEKTILLSKEEMTINGRKILNEKDVLSAAEKLKKEEFGWEI